MVAPSHFDQRPFPDEPLDVRRLAVGFHEFGIRPAGCPEAQHEGFHNLVFHAEGLLRAGVAGNLVAVPAPAPSTEGVGRRAKPYIRPPLPVSAVVLGLESGLGEVGYLVMVVSCSVKLVAEDSVLAGALVVIGLHILPVFQPVGAGSRKCAPASVPGYRQWCAPILRR